LELRPRPMSREHARPQPPAGSRRYGGGAEEPAPVPVGVTGQDRTQRPRGQVGPPGPHPAQPSSSLNPGGERRPISSPLAPLIAQLVEGKGHGLATCICGRLVVAMQYNVLCWCVRSARTAQARSPASCVRRSAAHRHILSAFRISPVACGLRGRGRMAYGVPPQPAAAASVPPQYVDPSRKPNFQRNGPGPAVASLCKGMGQWQ
jgi:hypothetical protein